MKTGLQLELKGAKEAMEELRELPRRMARGILRSAIQAGATKGAKLARAKAPKRIAKRIKGVKRSTGDLFSAHSTIDSYSPLSHLLEYGHNIVKKRGYIPGVKKRMRIGTVARGIGTIEKTGKKANLPVIGRVSPHPFMRPAYETGADQIEAAIKAKLKAGIAKGRAKLDASD